ncbi:MAG TPA: hypothetical protein VF265_01500 [Nevskiaceae bacterium]
MHDAMLDTLPPRLQPLAAIVVGVVLLVETWWHGRAGWVGSELSGRTLREKSPTGFWSMIAIKVVIALVAIWLGLRYW